MWEFSASFDRIYTIYYSYKAYFSVTFSINAYYFNDWGSVGGSLLFIQANAFENFSKNDLSTEDILVKYSAFFYNSSML